MENKHFSESRQSCRRSEHPRRSLVDRRQEVPKSLDFLFDNQNRTIGVRRTAERRVLANRRVTEGQLHTLNRYRKDVKGDEAASQAMMHIFMDAQTKKGSVEVEDKVVKAYRDKPLWFGRHCSSAKQARRADATFTMRKHEAPHTPPQGRDVTYEKG